MVAAHTERLGGPHLQHVMSWPEVILSGQNPAKLSDAVSMLRDMTIRRTAHVGVVVEDLEGATASFAELGMDLEGEAPVGDAGRGNAPANTLGIRCIMFAVEDIEDVLLSPDGRRAASEAEVRGQHWPRPSA
jgi:hypothetical protein